MSQILGDDPENSYYLMQLAALEHNAHASLLCGEEELRRMGTPAFRYERVSRYANEAIEGGEYDGYYLLACLEKRGDSNFKDSGIAYLLKGIEKQSGICADTLGRYYEGGTEENDERAMDYFQKAMEWHHPLGTYDFGRTFLGPAFHRVDLKQAEKYMRLAADLGCTDADYALGRHYEDGDFGTVDYPSAERYFVKGMECHSENCFYALAYLQVFYDVKQPRYEWARHAFLHLSHKGWRYASFNLGSMAYYGYGQKINYLEALEYYCLAADQGDGRGAYLAGEMLHSGKLVTPDPKRALHFLSLAAQKGEVDAAMLLAKMYETGDGVTKDLNLAATYRAQAKSAKA
jgi:TPR repeat protein